MTLGEAIDAMAKGTVFAHPRIPDAKVTIASAATTPGLRQTMYGEWVIDTGTGWRMYFLSSADRTVDWIAS